MIETFDSNYWKSEVLNVGAVINDNLNLVTNENRQIISSNILAHLRDLLNATVAFLYTNDRNEHGDNRYKLITEGVSYVSKVSKYNFLNVFHLKLKESVSHYTLRGEYAERMLLHYYEDILMLKTFLKQEYDMNIIEDLSKYPLDLDDSLKNYYRTILNALDLNYNSDDKKGTNSYYIQKKKPIYIDGNLFYEYTLSLAQDNLSKFGRFIAYSRINIFPNYAIRASFVSRPVKVLGNVLEVSIISTYWVAIRPCEFRHIAHILNISSQFKRTLQYDKIMTFIQNKHLSLSQIICFDDEQYSNFIAEINDSKFPNTNYIQLLNRARKFIKDNNVGKNVILYLLGFMNNTVIKNQEYYKENEKVSNLRIKSGVLVFEETPYSSALIQHNPKLSIVCDSIDLPNREDEFLKREIINNSNDKGVLYYNFDSITEEEADDLIGKYNKRIPDFQSQRRLDRVGKNIFNIENEKNTKYVLKILINKSKEVSFPDYHNYSKSIIDMLAMEIDDPQKKEVILNMFETTSVFCVYGAAGTGKSTLIGKELEVLGKLKKLCLANTHPAVQNMKRKINDSEAVYLTIKKFISSNQYDYSWDVLVIDECSTVSTKDMVSILSKISAKLIILSGDIFQIPSIKFGNWYSLLRKFIDKKCYVDLLKTYRSNSNNLIELWDRVRKIDTFIPELLNNMKISHVLDESIFEKEDDDEIILCLNYDGLYGINNINKILQTNNHNSPIKWDNYIFKVNDPIIFNESDRFDGILFNNLKGKINNIEIQNNEIVFELEVDTTLNPITDYSYYGFELLKVLENKKSLIRMAVQKSASDDYDNDTPINKQIPFQVAYAVSIHKAQGLEYNSVKIVITREVEEEISHNIFYTAITRAREKLRIYWSQETEQKVISSFEHNNVNRDASILASRASFKIVNKD